MLGRASARCHDILREGLRAGRRPRRPCVPAAVRAAPGGGGRGPSRGQSPGIPARNPCLRSKGREGDVVRCLRNHRLRLAQALSVGQRSAPQVPESRRNGVSEAAAAAAACVSAPAPSGLSPRNCTQRSCIPLSVPVSGRAAPVLLSSGRSRQRRPTVLPSPRVLRPRARLGAPSRLWCEVPPRPSARAAARGPRRAVRSSRCAAGCSELLPGPPVSRVAGPGCAGPVTAAATVLAGAPRRLPGRRRRHTWDAEGSKLGADVSGPAGPAPGRAQPGGRAETGKGGADPLRRPNGIGEGGGDRGNAPAHSASPAAASPPWSRAGGRGSSRGLTDSSGRPGPGPLTSTPPATRCVRISQMPHTHLSPSQPRPSPDPLRYAPLRPPSPHPPLPRPFLEPSKVLLAAAPWTARRATPPFDQRTEFLQQL